MSKCGCIDSLAVICGGFASLAVAAIIAEDRCLDRGGRVSESAWSCELAPGVIESIWGLLTPGLTAWAVIGAGVPVYFAVRALGRRRSIAHGNGHGHG